MRRRIKQTVGELLDLFAAQGIDIEPGFLRVVREIAALFLQQVEKRVVDARLDEQIGRYEPSASAGHRIEHDLSRADVVWLLTQLAPAAFVDGAWVQGACSSPWAASESAALLLRIYRDELGSGVVRQHHGNVMRSVQDDEHRAVLETGNGLRFANEARRDSRRRRELDVQDLYSDITIQDIVTRPEHGGKPTLTQQGSKSKFLPERLCKRGWRASRSMAVPQTRIAGRVLLVGAALLVVWLFAVWPPPIWWRSHTPRCTAMMRFRSDCGPADRRATTNHSSSRTLERMVIIAEDSRFRTHHGIDFVEMREALAAGGRRGASTITQQLAKNLYLSPSRNPIRKIREYFIARSLEKHLTKKRILEIYLNVFELGERVYGAEAASRHYFGKSASALTPNEAALLAGALPNPRVMNPGDPNKRLRARQRMILSRMRRWGYLFERQVLAEKKPQPETTTTTALDTAATAPVTDTDLSPPPPETETIETETAETETTDTAATGTISTDTTTPP